MTAIFGGYMKQFGKYKSQLRTIEKEKREYLEMVKRKYRIRVWEGRGLRWMNAPVKVNFT